jgi:hypothetical protein
MGSLSYQDGVCFHRRMLDGCHLRMEVFFGTNVIIYNCYYRA